jgi:hypothetical protein
MECGGREELRGVVLLEPVLLEKESTVHRGKSVMAVYSRGPRDTLRQIRKFAYLNLNGYA